MTTSTVSAGSRGTGRSLVLRQQGHGTAGFYRPPVNTGIGLADLIIAATAERAGLPLATTNGRHFPMLKGLRPRY